MLLADVALLHAERFFPGERVRECVAFRISRNADLSVREDMASDLRLEMEQVLESRKESDCVRLEVDASAGADARRFLMTALAVQEPDVYDLPGPLDLSAFMRVASLPGFDDLKPEAWSPQASPTLDPRESMFDQLSRHDVLLCHPF
jgi:polyphosphate kinase